MFKASAVVHHSNFWLYLNKLALWDPVFEALQVTVELGLLIHIHTEACAVNHCGCSVVLFSGQRSLSENSSLFWGEASLKALVTYSGFF